MKAGARIGGVGTQVLAGWQHDGLDRRFPQLTEGWSGAGSLSAVAQDNALALAWK
jgi:hypothetical protein